MNCYQCVGEKYIVKDTATYQGCQKKIELTISQDSRDNAAEPEGKLEWLGECSRMRTELY